MAGAAFAAIDSTAGAAAPKTQIGLLAATVRARVRGLRIGNTAATSAGGNRFVLNAVSTAGTKTDITAANTKLDPNSPSPITVASSTYTAEPTSGVTTEDFGFDRVGTYILWYPPGAEPFVTGATRLALQKTVGSETDVLAGTVVWSED
jgi:hypothetical protein